MLNEDSDDPLTTRIPPVRDLVSADARVLARRHAKLARASIVYRQWRAPVPPPSYVVRDVIVAILVVVLGLVFLFSDVAPAPIIAGW